VIYKPSVYSFSLRRERRARHLDASDERPDAHAAVVREGLGFGSDLIDEIACGHLRSEAA